MLSTLLMFMTPRGFRSKTRAHDQGLLYQDDGKEILSPGGNAMSKSYDYIVCRLPARRAVCWGRD